MEEMHEASPCRLWKQHARETFLKADELLKDSRQAFADAHEVQTALISDEVSGKSVPITLLMMHAQDHIMNAESIYDLGCQIVELCRQLDLNRQQQRRKQN
jgi:cellobiose PTS system EIIA component